MNAAAPRVVLVGAGRTGAAILAGIPRAWPVCAVDADPAALAGLRREAGELTCVRGDATSRLVLASAGTDNRAVVIAVTGSDEVNREVARVARREFGTEETVCLLQDAEDLESIGLTAAQVIVRDRATAAQVLNAAGLGATRSVALGLGLGELIQVAVLQGSPAAGRPLREIGATGWLVAAVYRGDALIVPHGDTAVLPGDRVILVGEPDVLTHVAAFFHGGDPVFPNQFGARLGVGEGETAAAAAAWLHERSRAVGIVPIPAEALADTTEPRALAAGLRERDVGCLVVEPRAIPLHVRVGLAPSRWQRLLAASGRPVLVARGPNPCRRVLVALGAAEAAARVAPVALDLARQLAVPLTALTVQPPALGGAREAPKLPSSLAEAGRLHGMEVNWIVDEGNPIERIRAHAADHDLVVAGLSGSARNSVFTPDVSLFLLHQLPCSVLFVPWRVQGR